MNRRQFLGRAAAAAGAAGGVAAGAPDAPGAGARFRTAICAYSFRKALEAKSMTYEDLIRLAVETGVDGLDLTVYWFPDTSDGFLLPLRRRAYRMGVELYSIAVRTDLCRPTEEGRDKELAGIRRWVDVAQKLGAGHVRIFGGNVPKGFSEDQAAGWVAETLKRGGEYAGSQGVILGLENHGGITERAARILDIVRRVDSPWVGINLDTGNFREKVFEQIEMCLPWAVNTQVKAEMRSPDGSRGAADWDRVFAMFARHGYQGYMAIEYEAEEDSKTAVPRACRRLRQLAQKYSAAVTG